MTDVTLYHIWPSHCSQKVRLALAEKGVEYKSSIVNIGPAAENYEPWYARLNPDLVVPTLQHADEIVTDSRRIVDYVDSAFDGPPLRPDSPAADRRTTALMDLADSLDIRAVSYAAIPTIVTRFVTWKRARKLARLRDRNPDLREIYERKLQDVRNWRDSVLVAEQLDVKRQALIEALDRVEAGLTEHDFVACDQYTLADVLWTCVAARIEMNGGEELIRKRPALRDWYGRMRERPSFDEAEVWTAMRPARMLSIVGPYLLPRIAVVLVLGGGLVYVAASL